MSAHALAMHPVSVTPDDRFQAALWSQRAAGGAADWTAELRPGGAVLRFAPDQEIYAEGDEAEKFYKVVSGVVRTCKFLSDGRRQIDAFYRAGDVFGIEASEDYGLTAEAVCDVSVVSYRRSHLDTLAAANPNLSRHLLAYAMSSVAKAQEHSLLLGRRNAIEKVVAFLVDWAAQSTDGAMATLAMTRQDMADYLGLTIETVSRTLSHLEREAIIELPSARQIRLRDPDAMAMMSC
jgi:CRP/FNR family nitrogen fixation transcriptional regulator